jgi:hypothetical protein
LNLKKSDKTTLKNTNFLPKIFILFLITIIGSDIFAQTVFKGDLPYVVTTGVPFMRIAPDARSSGMAEAGVSTNADNYSGFHNPAKFAFIENDMGASFNFAPWLRQITNDIYLINVNGYKKINENHVMAGGIRYFTLGQINYTGPNAEPRGFSKPFEVTAEGHYAFRLAEFLSIGASGRFILSNLSNNSSENAPQIPAGTAVGLDLAMFYSKPLEIRNFESSKINFGVNLSNLGTKIQYLDIGTPDYIPTNLAIGGTFEGNLDQYNGFSATLQLDKLLVPNPTYTLNSNNERVLLDANSNGIADFKELSSIGGAFSSFTDNGDGFAGELKEFIVKIAAEYSYEKAYFARAGFFYEPDAAGGRQFATLGLGVKYNTMKIDFSYLLPITQQRSPLDNQMRVSLAFNLGDSKKSSY